LRTRRKLALSIAAVLAALSVTVLVPTVAQAHGSMTSPVSRTYACFVQGPEDPDTDVCADAIDQGGTQPLYDWFEVRILNNAGRHRELIPDGKLCSANNPKYAAFDMARRDWPATTLQAGSQFTFTYAAWAPHPGPFELYVTRDGYDPTQPLKWSDLEATPFSVAPNPPIISGAYTWTAQLPAGKTGRHLIYAIWQRTDSPEAFFSCSDVVFGSEPPPPPPPPITCTASVSLDNSWPGGFQSTVTVTNTGSESVTPWTVSWTLPPGTTLASGWNATLTQSGSTVTAEAPSWSRTVRTGSSVSIGFVANGSPSATGVQLNGSACT
jgi:chitin-binding protein